MLKSSWRSDPYCSRGRASTLSKNARMASAWLLLAGYPSWTSVCFYGDCMQQIVEDSRAARAALVERILLARVMGDFDFLESISAPDIVVKLIGDRALFAYCGEYHGRKDARQALEQAYIEFSFHNMNIDHMLIEGDQVVMRWSGVLRNRGTGARGHFEGFTHLIFEDGLVKEYYALVDTASMGKLARPD